MGVSATDLTAVSMLLIGIGSLLGGLGVFLWGARLLFFTRRELQSERVATRGAEGGRVIGGAVAPN